MLHFTFLINKMIYEDHTTSGPLYRLFAFLHTILKVLEIFKFNLYFYKNVYKFNIKFQIKN